MLYVCVQPLGYDRPTGQPLAYLNYLIDLFRAVTGPSQIDSDRYCFLHMDEHGLDPSLEQCTLKSKCRMTPSFS